MADTSIEWTDATWNPIAGCSIMSAGCSNCYAMRMAARLEAMGLEKYRNLTRKSGGKAKWTGAIYLDHAALDTPEKWTKPRNIFVNSMSDLFHPDVPEWFIEKIWGVMKRTPRHNYQILTKRPDRMLSILLNKLEKLPNVWLGTSVENSSVIQRIEDLKRTPAVVHFVSFEPLIGPVSNANLEGIDWAIVGGESGPNARAIETYWIDEIFEICTQSDTKFFFKQWGGKNKKQAGRIYRERTWDELPTLSM